MDAQPILHLAVFSCSVEPKVEIFDLLSFWEQRKGVFQKRLINSRSLTMCRSAFPPNSWLL